MANPLLMRDENIVSIEFIKGEPMTNSFEEIQSEDKHRDRIIIEYFVGTEARTRTIYADLDDFSSIAEYLPSDEYTRMVDWE